MGMTQSRRRNVSCHSANNISRFLKVSVQTKRVTTNVLEQEAFWLWNISHQLEEQPCRGAVRCLYPEHPGEQAAAPRAARVRYRALVRPCRRGPGPGRAPTLPGTGVGLTLRAQLQLMTDLPWGYKTDRLLIVCSGEPSTCFLVFPTNC